MKIKLVWSVVIALGMVMGAQAASTAVAPSTPVVSVPVPSPTPPTPRVIMVVAAAAIVARPLAGEATYGGFPSAWTYGAFRPVLPVRVEVFSPVFP